jgi:hypothetical protein
MATSIETENACLLFGYEDRKVIGNINQIDYKIKYAWIMADTHSGNMLVISRTRSSWPTSYYIKYPCHILF